MAFLPNEYECLGGLAKAGHDASGAQSALGAACSHCSVCAACNNCAAGHPSAVCMHCEARGSEETLVGRRTSPE